MKVYALFNIKGGVGKTASAVNLSFLSAEEGARTAVWDLDPQGAASFYFRIRPRVAGGGAKLVAKKKRLPKVVKGTDFERLDLIPADFPYRSLDLALDATKKRARRLAQLLQPLEDEYDYLFLDCPPSISLTSEGVFLAADTLLVPTVPTPLSLHTLQQLADHLEGHGPKRLRVLPFFCLVDRRKKLHREVCDRRETGPYPFLATEIPYASPVERMGVHRAPLCSYAPWTAAARAYRQLWEEVRAAEP